MTDLHEEFGAWIAGGARDELARDVAVHASGCDACLVHAAAFDALLAIDPDAAAEPPLRAAPIPGFPSGPIRVARAAAGALSVMLVVGAGVIAGSSLFRPLATGESASIVDPTPAEGVLAGEGGPSEIPSASPTVVESATPTPTASPVPSESDASAEPAITAATPRPTMGGGPPPISTARPSTPQPVPTTPRPTATPAIAPTTAASATPAPPTATPTATPTSEPPQPTVAPTPAPTPIPSDCLIDPLLCP